MSTDELAHEQRYVSALYQRVDDLQGRAAQRLARVLREHAETPQALTEREAEVARCQEQLARLDAAGPGLCFGRLDLHDGERRYIGRIGLFDEERGLPAVADRLAGTGGPTVLLGHPGGAAACDGAGTSAPGTGSWSVSTMRCSTSPKARWHRDTRAWSTRRRCWQRSAPGRTGRMADIVATIQAEQDRVIRADHRGVLVVEGGPGDW